MELHVNDISNAADFETYLEIVESFDVINPFYKIFGASLDESLLHQLHYFTLTDNEGNILILMPFFLRKIPYQDQADTYYDVISPYGYSGPLYNENMSRGYLIVFWELIDAWYKEHHIISEFMRFSLNHNHQFYSGVLIPTLTNVRGKILEDSEQWLAFKQKVRNNYRKAQDVGLEARFFSKGLPLEVIKTFHDIYIGTMTRIGADSSYFYSLNYFKNIIELSDKNFVIVLIYKDDIPISTELILIAGDTLYSFLGGTVSDYFQYRPNDFLKIEVMKWARLHQHDYYLLGGGRSDEDSLYHYKKSFFPDDQDVIYYTGRKIVNKKIYDKLDRLLNVDVQIENQDKSVKNDKSSYFPAYRRYQNKKDRI